MKKNKITIIGRPNTGKSTLFNKIIGERKTITNKLAGTTRDIISRDTSWQGISFELSDTGGIDYKKTGLERIVQLQTEKTLKETDVILLLINIREGITTEDLIIVKKLKKLKKKIILVANKADDNKLRQQLYDFYKLGLGKPLAISAISGIGVGDLLDKIIYLLKEKGDNSLLEENEGIKVSIIGKPNVGKSSLLNAIYGDIRALVSEIPGTTRDTIDILIPYKNKKIILTDTAGLRRKTKIDSEVEKFSAVKSLKKIKNSEICLLILDAVEKISHQDLRLASEIIKNQKSIILVVNKWDIIKSKLSLKEEKIKMSQFIDYFQSHFTFLYWAPIIFISAKYKKNINQILELIINIAEERGKIIPQEELTKTLDKTTEDFFTSKKNNTFRKKSKIKKFVQVGIFPPRFNLHVKTKENVPNSYLNFLEKKLRAKFELMGTPTKINLRVND